VQRRERAAHPRDRRASLDHLRHVGGQRQRAIRGVARLVVVPGPEQRVGQQVYRLRIPRIAFGRGAHVAQ
jgi:hypothetical protein